MNFTQEQRYEIIEKIIKEGKGIEEILKIMDTGIERRMDEAGCWS